MEKPNWIHSLRFLYKFFARASNSDAYICIGKVECMKMQSKVGVLLLQLNI